MQVISNKDAIVVIKGLITTIQDNKEYLSEIDGKIGDGDHGINMNKGFTLCGERLDAEDTLSSGLEKLGNVLLAEIGGSMGPLYGTFFLAMKGAMKETSEGKEQIDAKIFGEMLQSAYNEITELGGAKVGDKTLIDTLTPAIESYQQALSDNKSFEEILIAMDHAAEVGYKSTEDMVAKIGRASRLGERSRGVLDAGATSCYLLLHSMKESIVSLLKEGV